MEVKNKVAAIREHNRIHQSKEPRAIYITKYLEEAAQAMLELDKRNGQCCETCLCFQQGACILLKTSPPNSKVFRCNMYK